MHIRNLPKSVGIIYLKRQTDASANGRFSRGRKRPLPLAEYFYPAEPLIAMTSAPIRGFTYVSQSPFEREAHMLNEQHPYVETRIPIEKDSDIVTARQQGRTIAERVGFRPSERTIISLAISELARNILQYAKTGEIILQEHSLNRRRGVVIIAADRGPGIEDVARAVKNGFSTSGGLGLGLPGVKRLMDEFEIDSVPGQGTRVVVRKWKL